MLAAGCSSRPWSWASRLRSHSSSLVSSEKSASTAPDLVPVTRAGLEPGDQAKAAVRGISLSRTMASTVTVERLRGKMTEGERRGVERGLFRAAGPGLEIFGRLGILNKHQKPYGKGVGPREWRVGGAIGDGSSRIEERRVARLPRPRPLRLLACAHSALQGMPPQKFGAV